MRIGELDRRITIQQPTRIADGSGGYKEIWSDFKTVSAHKRKKTGILIFAGDKFAVENTVIYDMRYISGIDITMRVVEDNKVYQIVLVDDTRKRRGELSLECREVI